MKKGVFPLPVSLPVDDPMSCLMMLLDARANEKPLLTALWQ